MNGEQSAGADAGNRAAHPRVSHLIGSDRGWDCQATGMKYTADLNRPLTLIESEIRRYCKGPRTAEQISEKLRRLFRRRGIKGAIRSLVSLGLLRRIGGAHTTQYQWSGAVRGRGLLSAEQQKQKQKQEELSGAIQQDQRRGRSRRAGEKRPPEGTHRIQPYP